MVTRARVSPRFFTMSSPLKRGRVLLTDHPWPDADIESRICAEAGFELVDAPKDAGPEELLALGRDVVGIITCWAQVPRLLINASPDLVVVSRLGVGIDNIDVASAHERGVVVTRVPDYCVEEVSDHAVALVFAWARGIANLDRSVRAGLWGAGDYQLRRVRDLTIGVWGTGLNGIRTGEKLSALGCTVFFDDRHPERVPAMDVLSVSELLGRCDVLSLHLPLNEENKRIVGAEILARMRPNSLLVNTARGGLIDTEALASALDQRRPGFAALDVLPHEPDVPPALARRDDVLITPHVAFSSVQSVRELRQRTTEDLVRTLRGEQPMDPVE